MKDRNLLEPLIQEIRKRGGTAMLIGGAVIDSINRKEIRDWDIEVYNMSLMNIVEMLEDLALPSDLVGKAFGVIKTRINGLELDLSVPRRDNKVGIGNKGFTVTLEPNMTPKEAGRRRDISINSMYLNLHTDDLVDPYNCLADSKNGVICATDP